MIKAIETSYAGCRFRSRLEARWAVFFNEMSIGWQYEPQGFVIEDRPYLPDFLLDCGTWIEVKGSEAQLDRRLMEAAANELPWSGVVSGDPSLMLLGPIPEPQSCDLGWLGFTHTGNKIDTYWYGFDFGTPWFVNAGNPDLTGPWLTPVQGSSGILSRTALAYKAARSARFEHGQHGA